PGPCLFRWRPFLRRGARMTANRFAAVATLGLVLAGRAPAQNYVTVPNIYENQSGGGYSAILIAPHHNPWSVPLIWTPNQLVHLLVAPRTPGVPYRRGSDVPNGYPFSATSWTDYRISFAPSVLPNQASGTFTDNFLAPATLVRSGTLTVAPFAWPAGG